MPCFVVVVVVVVAADCASLLPQRHGPDEEAGMRRHQDQLPRRTPGAGGVGPAGDPHQPGVGPRLSGTLAPPTGHLAG